MKKTYNLGNNEQANVGVFENADGSFTAMTFSASKEFKTYRGAVNWLRRRNVNV